MSQKAVSGLCADQDPLAGLCTSMPTASNFRSCCLQRPNSATVRGGCGRRKRASIDRSVACEESCTRHDDTTPGLRRRSWTLESHVLSDSGLSGLIYEKAEPLGTLEDHVVCLVFGLERLSTRLGDSFGQVRILDDFGAGGCEPLGVVGYP